ncbi:MAG: Sigma-70, region 4 [Solirubrobacteraceae bacterium]|jgi:RNA polymerase sigma factor (sigma-70 family)|nr:Sigma-70, region 4 [Solirubrobacteraceae bacterium]
MAVHIASGQQSLERIAARERELVRWLHAHFRKRLSCDDVRDAVADAIAVAHEQIDNLAHLDADGLERWVRKRAEFNAIDQIRAIDGYGRVRRPASVSVDDYAETLPDSGVDDLLEAMDGEILAYQGGTDEARSVALALERLTSDERRVLRLRYGDDLPVKAIAELLDIHPKKYERLHTRALKKLRTVFIETVAGENCLPIRQLIASSREQQVSRELSLRIAAHVESCAQCRAYERRSLKLIAAMPLPAAHGLDRCWARMQDLWGTMGGHVDGATAGATGTAAVAGVGGAATSTGVIASISAKVVVGCGGAIVTACVGVLALPALEGTDRKSSVRAAEPTTGASTTHAPRTPARVSTTITSAAAKPAAERRPTKRIARAPSKATSRAGAASATGGTATPRSGGERRGSLTVETFATSASAATSPSVAPVRSPPPPPVSDGAYAELFP